MGPAVSLRTQLFLVSLLTLSLPWAGCQYIQEMEASLRHGQTDAMQATAKAVAARLASEPNLWQPLDHPHTSAAQHLYAHPLPSAGIVDGYNDEWEGLEFTPRVFQSSRNQQFSAQVLAGIHQQTLYLLIRVNDPKLHYHHPSRATLASGDHIIVRTAATDYIVATSAPGGIEVKYKDANNQRQREHRVRGQWVEHQQGYQVELSLPLDMVQPIFELGIVDHLVQDAPTIDPITGNPVSQSWPVDLIGTIEQPTDTYQPIHLNPSNIAQQLSAAKGQLISPLAPLQAATQVFTREGIRLRILDQQGWLVASSGSLRSAQVQAQQPPWWLRALYELALTDNSWPTPHDSTRDGFIEPIATTDSGKNNHLGRSPTSIPAHQWYQDGRRQLGRSSAVIEVNNEATDRSISQYPEPVAVGTVLVEQTSDRVLALTNSAFTRLFLFTTGATLLATFGLVGYASWLSWRIRRINRAATAAVNTDGHIGELESVWPQYEWQDELGELSGNYQHLLQRLQGYTDYLRTLTSKLSHELRTPLAIVRSSLDNLSHSQLDKQALTYTARAADGAERLSRLISAMSEASRVEHSIQQADKEWFALDDMCQQLTAAYADTFTHHSFNCVIKPADYQLWGAPDLLVQLLDKLVDNATDFCPAGGCITLELLRHSRKSGDSLTLHLSNQGPLLPEHLQDQLFDSLVSIRSKTPSSAPTTNSDTHMGLGLYIVKLIAQYHRGRVYARNLDDDSGVRFSLQLPILPTVEKE